MLLDYKRIKVICKLALEEDLQDAGDVTTKAIIPPDLMMQAFFVTRQECVFCGWPVQSSFSRCWILTSRWK